MKNKIFNNKTNIAIIGFGRMGQLLTNILLKHSPANIIVISSKKDKSNNPGVRFAEIKEVNKADIIIPCVPISAFEKTIQKISPIINPNSIVIDICSVKVKPVKAMEKNLPQSVQIIASHPMFGPDSFKINQGLNGLRLVLYNVRAKEKDFNSIKEFFQSLKLNVIELSPKQHDKFMAWSLGYSFLIGKISQRLNIIPTPIDTHDFKLLLENKEIINNDSEELFFDMQTQNSFAKEVRSQFRQVVKQLFQEIKDHA